MNANELARVLNEALCVEFGIRANSPPAAMRAGASVNQVTLNRMQFIFPKLLNVVCFSHMLYNVGSHLIIPTIVFRSWETYESDFFTATGQNWYGTI